MKNDTYSIDLVSVFTPSFDPVVGQSFTGNHVDFSVVFDRDGDSVFVRTYGTKGIGPVRPLLSEERHSIEDVVAVIRRECDDHGFGLELTDNLPEGISYPSTKLAA